MINVFSYPSHDTSQRASGVDFARIIQPMRHLNKVKGFNVTLWDRSEFPKQMSWENVAKHSDVLYFNYMNNAWGFAMMGLMARKYNRLMVMDLDDCLWRIKKDNPASEVFQEGQEAIKTISAICNEVDYMTCTNNYLKNLIIENTTKNHKRIFVLPNFIDFDLYNHKSKFKNTPFIQLTHFGSTTHFNDLLQPVFMDALKKIMYEYPNVTIKTIGSFLPQYKELWGHRYVNCFGHIDIFKWIKEKYPSYMDETDIFLTPLQDDIYTRSKSAIKYLEVSAAGIPGCWQDIHQYREVIKHGQNGFLCKTTNGWYHSIKKLIDDVELRRRMGQNAYDYVKKNWTIQKNIYRYADFFKFILDN